MADEVEGAGGFGGDGDEANVAAGGLLEAVEEGDVGGKDVGGRVDSALGVGDEGAFEVDAYGGGLFGLGFLFDCVGYAF